MRPFSQLFLSIACVVLAPTQAHAKAPGTFKVWVFADAHVGSDKAGGRESLAAAIEQSEGPSGFDWDIALDLGEISRLLSAGHAARSLLPILGRQQARLRRF
ncbi:MAG: hypothetical protein ABI769_02465 [Pseudomonadota bacterium]